MRRAVGFGDPAVAQTRTTATAAPAGAGTSQPKQQGSKVQLLNIISSPVPLSACDARLEAAAELEGDARHDVPPVGGMHTWCMERAALKWSAVAMKTRASARSSANAQTLGRAP